MKAQNNKPKNRKEQLAQEKAFAALALMRREKLSRTAAAKRAGTDPKTVLRYVGSALKRKGDRGRYYAKPYDRIPRILTFTTPGRKVVVTVNSSRTASLISDYSNAVRKFLRTNDESLLSRFRRKTFRAGKQTYEFITDPDALQEIGRSGFRGENLYRVVRGGN